MATSLDTLSLCDVKEGSNFFLKVDSTQWPGDGSAPLMAKHDFGGYLGVGGWRYFIVELCSCIRFSPVLYYHMQLICTSIFYSVNQSDGWVVLTEEKGKKKTKQSKTLKQTNRRDCTPLFPHWLLSELIELYIYIYIFFVFLFVVFIHLDFLICDLRARKLLVQFVFFFKPISLFKFGNKERPKWNTTAVAPLEEHSVSARNARNGAARREGEQILRD